MSWGNRVRPDPSRGTLLQLRPFPRYGSLNPLTRLLFALVVPLDAVLWGGLIAPLVLLVIAVLVPALSSGVLRQVVRVSLVSVLPLSLSVLVVNLFFFSGAQEVLLRVGTLTATREGLQFAVETLVRLAVLAGALALFSATTSPSSLFLDLERRGLPRQFALLLWTAADNLAEVRRRARVTLEAQRARGLETEGWFGSRLLAIVPLMGPLMVSTLEGVESRVIGLEIRGFGAIRRRTLLWTPSDSVLDEKLRLLILVSVPAVFFARRLLG